MEEREKIIRERAVCWVSLQNTPEIHEEKFLSGCLTQKFSEGPIRVSTFVCVIIPEILANYS